MEQTNSRSRTRKHHLKLDSESSITSLAFGALELDMPRSTKAGSEPTAGTNYITPDNTQHVQARDIYPRDTRIQRRSIVLILSLEYTPLGDIVGCRIRTTGADKGMGNKESCEARTLLVPPFRDHGSCLITYSEKLITHIQTRSGV